MVCSTRRAWLSSSISICRRPCKRRSRPARLPWHSASRRSGSLAERACRIRCSSNSARARNRGAYALEHVRHAAEIDAVGDLQCGELGVGDDRSQELPVDQVGLGIEADADRRWRSITSSWKRRRAVSAARRSVRSVNRSTKPSSRSGDGETGSARICSGPWRPAPSMRRTSPRQDAMIVDQFAQALPCCAGRQERRRATRPATAAAARPAATGDRMRHW